MTREAQIPSYKDLLWPTLRAVREIGDSGTIEEIVEKVTEIEGFTEQQQSVAHGQSPNSEIEYRLAWARTYLKGMGALINSTRGVWSTTELGRELTPEQVMSRHAAYVAELRAARRKKRNAATVDPDDGGAPDTDDGAERDWKEQPWIHRSFVGESAALCGRALGRV